MKTKCGLISFCLLAMLLCAAPAQVMAQFTFTTNTDGSLNIAGYTGSGGALTVPDTTNGLPITSIGTNAFYGCVIIGSLTLGTNLTRIGDGAFYQSGLTNINLGTNVNHIGNQAFDFCGFTGLTLPEGLVSIGNEAFANISYLTSVTIPESVTNIGEGAFADGNNLTAISVDAANPAYTSVGGVLFDKSQLVLIQYPQGLTGNYTIPNGVTRIEENAFYGGPGPSTVTIPASVTSIGDEAFFQCFQLESITVGATNPVYSSSGGVLFNKDQTTLVQCPGTIATGYVIPDSVTSIGDGAFCVGTYMSHITIPNSVTNIGADAFFNCGSLTNITIPASVASIGSRAFNECFDLTALNVDTNNVDYCSVDGVLFNKDQTLLLQYPIGSNATNYVVPDSVTSIGFGAFTQSHELTRVLLDDNLTNIGTNAFAGDYLTSVNIPNGVTSIGPSAFFGNSQLTSITVPGSVTNIGGMAFFYCQRLNNVYFAGNAPAPDLSVFFHENPKIYYLPGTTGWGPTYDNFPTVLWNPQVQTGDGSFGVQNHHFGFNINGTDGLVIVVEACTDLANPTWFPVGTNTLTGGTSYFSDPQGQNYPDRFYRLRSP